MGLLDLSRDQFLSAVSELAAQGVNTDELVRQYRRQNSPFAAAYDWADRAASNVADRGREAGFFGLLSKPEGASGMEAIRNLRVEPQNFAAGLLGGVAQAVDAPSAAAMGLIPSQDMPMEALNTAGMTQLGGAAMPAPSGALRAGALRSFDVTRKDASNIFGAGTERIRYTDPASGGTMEVVVRPNGSASVLELEVPEASRGQGVGQALQERVLQDYPVMGGQVSSKAAATTAYRIGRRPYGMPDATLDDVFRMIDEDSSVNLISQKAQPVTLPAARNEAEAMARQILDMRAAGRAGEVTDAMMAQADPQYMFANTPLPMDEASRMVRANQYFPDTAYHSTGRDFQEFIPSEFRGASFFGSTPEGAARGASASANEGVGSGSTITMPVRVDASRVEGLGAYGRQDMNEFRASLPDRIYTEAEVDDIMASDMAPRYGDWTYFFDDLTDYDALSKFRDANPDAPIPEGIIKFKPKQPLSYGPDLRSNISGKQFAHYSEGMSERPISDYTKSIGNTGFTMMDESGLALAMTDPTAIRSRFARFDPEFSHLANLNAANASPLAGILAMPNEEERNRRLGLLSGGR
jgi:hypothetical protein